MPKPQVAADTDSVKLWSDQSGPLLTNNPACITCTRKRTECVGPANKACRCCRLRRTKCSLTPPRPPENESKAGTGKKGKGAMQPESSQPSAILAEATPNESNKKRSRKKVDGVQEDSERIRVKRPKTQANEPVSLKAPTAGANPSVYSKHSKSTQGASPTKLDGRISCPSLDASAPTISQNPIPSSSAESVPSLSRLQLIVRRYSKHNLATEVPEGASARRSSNPVRRLVLVNPDGPSFKRKPNLATSTVLGDEKTYTLRETRPSSNISEEEAHQEILIKDDNRSHLSKTKRTISPSPRTHMPTPTPSVLDDTSSENHARMDEDEISEAQEDARNRNKPSTPTTTTTKMPLPMAPSAEAISDTQDSPQLITSPTDMTVTSKDKGTQRREGDDDIISDSADVGSVINESNDIAQSTIGMLAQASRFPTPLTSEAEHHAAAAPAVAAAELNSNQVAAAVPSTPLSQYESLNAPLAITSLIAPGPEVSTEVTHHYCGDMEGEGEKNIYKKMRLLQDVLATQRAILETQQAMLALLD